MRRGIRRIAALVFTALLARARGAEARSAPQGKGTPKPSGEGLVVGTRIWTGDFDAMVKRRRIRVLVVYSKMFYFVDRGAQRGATYEALQLFERYVNRRLKTGKLPVHMVFLPVGRDQLIPALLDGRGDIAAANLGVTPEREAIVDCSNALRSDRDEIVVTGPTSKPVASLEDLAGKEVYVRKSSSYCENLERLNARFKREGRPSVRLRLAPENLQDDDLLEMLNAGLVGIVVVDAPVAKFWSQIFPNIRLHPDAAVAKGEHTAWMFRKNSPQLKDIVNDFLAKYPEGSLERNVILNKYLKSTRWVKSAASGEELKKFHETVELFRKYSGKYDMDYLLVMAQGYQESQLNQSARSHAGAIGIMQLMPATGKEMNVGDIEQMEPNIHAGVKYIRFMEDRYYAKEPMDPIDRGLFAFASYNAGPARIQELRRVAAQRGLDPNQWFNNVELVAAEKVGGQTVQYVSNIYKYYVAYKLITENLAERNREKAAFEKKRQ